MAKANQLEKALSRHIRQQRVERHELVDAFKQLQTLVEQLSAHLSREELEGILVDMGDQQTAGQTQPMDSHRKPAAES